MLQESEENVYIRIVTIFAIDIKDLVICLATNFFTKYYE